MYDQKHCREVITGGNFFKIKVASDQDPKEIAKELENDFDLVIISPHKCRTTVDEEECGTVEIMAIRKADDSTVSSGADFGGIAKVLSSIRPDDAPIRGRLQEIYDRVEIRQRRCKVEE